MPARNKNIRLREVVAALETIAPSRYAQSWDNVGLLAGDLNARCRRTLICLDMMPAVVDEAIAAKIDLIVAYHPPLFRPVSRLVTPSDEMASGIHRCIRKGIAIYSPHTALDVAPGGTNDVLANLCGVKNAKPIERELSAGRQAKVVVFVPATAAAAVAAAMSAAGAGIIGEYAQCSFRSSGVGTFYGGDKSRPVVGQRGRLEQVEEVRLEMVCPKQLLADTIAALRAAHPYETPAFDVYPLTSVATHGIGRVGALAKPTSLKDFARRVKRRCHAPCVSMVGQPQRQLSRAIIGVGAAGSLPFSLKLGPGDVVVTGEMRHHDALRLLRLGACALVLSHWSSERPAMKLFGERLQLAVAGLITTLSAADSEPFQRV